MKIKQSGQIVVVLLLMMLVVLSVGLALTQRSITDITTSTQTDQASRAFSAAEAGVEQAILSNQAITSSLDLGNQSSVKKVDIIPIPPAYTALEYPPIGKDKVATFWLSDPNNPGASAYGGTSLEVYFGKYNATDDPNSLETPAIEINLVTVTTVNGASNYKSNHFFIDPVSSRSQLNGFVFQACNATPYATNTSYSPPPRNFRCKTTITSLSSYGIPVLIRVRVLYSSSEQPVAVNPVGNCAGCLLPVQASIYTSTGISGQSQKTIQVFRQDNVVPQIFDYGVFSVGDIEK